MTNAVMASGTSAAHTSTRVARRLALGAIVGPVLFTLAWLVLGVVSNGYTLWGHTFTDYNPISQSISGLGVGDTAPYMNTAFVGTGLILIIGVIGVVRTVGAGVRGARATLVLLACTGLGQVGCGVFTLTAIMPHMLSFLLALGTPALSFVVAGRFFRRIPGWHTFGTWLACLGAPLALVLLIAYFIAFRPTADGAEHGVAGLIQRIAAIHAFSWFVAMGWRAFRTRSGHELGADRTGPR